MNLFHQHSPSLVSVNGQYTCQECFAQVEHPWYPAKSQKVSKAETGIERVQREQSSEIAELERMYR